MASMHCNKLLSFSVAVNAQAPRIDRVDIIDVGIYQTETASVIDDPNTPNGKLRNAGGVKLIKSTTTIPAQIGIEFGFRFRVVGDPSGSPVALKMVYRFPPPGMRINATKEMRLSVEVSSTAIIGGEGYLGGKFDEPSDLMPGKWMLELWYGDRKIAEQQFTVVEP